VCSDMVRGGERMRQVGQSSLEMLGESQAKMMENMSARNPMSKMPGVEAMRAQQEAFLKAMTGGLAGAWGSSGPQRDTGGSDDKAEDLDAIKRQLADLQDKLSKLS